MTGPFGHRQTVAIMLAALTAVILAVLAVVWLDGGGGGDPAARQEAPRTDPRAADRRAIQRTAMRYQRAAAPGSGEDPCRYMTVAAQAQLTVTTRGMSFGEHCHIVVRVHERRQATPVYETPATGVQNIRFGQVEVAGLEGTAPGATAQWRDDPGRGVTFKQDDNGEWLIAK